MFLVEATERDRLRVMCKLMRDHLGALAVLRNPCIPSQALIFVTGRDIESLSFNPRH